MPEPIENSPLQKDFLPEKIILVVSILTLILGLLVVGGSVLFNDSSYKTNPLDLTAGIVLIPLLVTIPLFLIKICLGMILQKQGSPILEQKLLMTKFTLPINLILGSQPLSFTARITLI